MDWIEEQRRLTHIEMVFRNIVKRKISSLIHLVAIAARQIGKVNWCVLGDEDSSFYNSRASARLRANQIKALEADGIRYFSHKEKERVFTNFYRNILGQCFDSQNLIDLDEIYPNVVDLSFLASPFSELEIYKALKQIPRDKSPGPDGFGSAFFQDYWNTLKPDIIGHFSEFYEGQARLDRNNRSYIVHIKKKEGICTPDAYRPISLLNYMVKLITKVLAIRLQNHLPKLIDDGQTGFVKSRCIADNFIYGLDSVQCCKIRKKKAIVLKLDFS
jgi:hypothetical protein